MTAESVSSQGSIINGNETLLSVHNRTNKPHGEARKAEAHKVAVEFQSLFVEMMLKTMRETAKQDKLTGGGHGEEVYGSLLDREYAIAISNRGNLGLAEMVEKQLLSQESGLVGNVNGNTIKK
jgi:Rod binding domain-containing protein